MNETVTDAMVEAALDAWFLGWKPYSEVPRDGSDIELLQRSGEIIAVRWNNERFCMLGSRAGSYPPGWSPASTEDVDGNLPIDVDDPTHWRRLHLSREATP